MDNIQDCGVQIYDVSGYGALDEIVRRENPDVVFFPIAVSLTKAYHGSVYKIGVVHDLRGLELGVDKYILLEQRGIKFLKTLVGYLWPSLYLAWRRWKMKRKIACLDMVVTVSEYSRRSIQRFSFLEQDRIKVLFSPCVLRKTLDVTCPEFDNLKVGKYILFLSVDRFVKNPYRAIQAIEILFERQELEGYKVVMTGTPSEHVRKQMKHSERYIILGYVSQEFLENLYAHCDVFLYASLSEGFGYPPLEAMNYGKTCAVSSMSSIPEVCGSAVYYFNPLDVYSIADGIMKAVKNKINQQLIRDHLDKISKRQSEDLDKLCRLILDGR